MKPLSDWTRMCRSDLWHLERLKQDLRTRPYEFRYLYEWAFVRARVSLRGTRVAFANKETP